VLGTIELSPNGGIYHVGDFDIVMPAGAVCDPETTKYGARYWNDDCTPAKHSITVNVVAKKRRSGVSVEFQPDLRFRPSAGWVIVQTNAYSSQLTSDAVRQLSPTSSFFQDFAILYAPSGGGSRIDEARSLRDRSMVTHVDLSTGLVWRRVKHFSGYLINAGFKCDPTSASDGSCVDDGSGGADTPLGAMSISDMVDTTLSLPSVMVDTTLGLPSVIVDP
jgi:hypothetical protein